MAFARDHVAPAGLGFNVAVAGQFAIGTLDGVGVDEKRFGQAADTGDGVAGGEAAGGNGVADLVNDLLVDGGVATGGDAEGEGHGDLGSVLTY